MYCSGRHVSWHSNGSTKKGVIVAVIPQGEVLLGSFRPSKISDSIKIDIPSSKVRGYNLSGLSEACMRIPRDEESYLIVVGNMLYWPRVKLLS